MCISEKPPLECLNGNKQISRSYRSELPGEAFAEERRNEHKPYEGIRNKTYDYAHIRALLRLPQIAVKHTSRVKEVTCDMPRCVDGHLEAPRHEDSNIALARRDISGDRSTGGAHEAVIRDARIGVNSRY